MGALAWGHKRTHSDEELLDISKEWYSHSPMFRNYHALSEGWYIMCNATWRNRRTEGILHVLEPVSPLRMELPGEGDWHHFLKSFSQGMAHRNGTRHLFRPARALGSLLVFRKSLVSGASALSSGQGASLWEASSCERPISALAWLKLKHQNSDDEVLRVPPSGGELL